MGLFFPYIDEATGEAHKNVQVIKTLKNLKEYSRNKVVFIFEDESPKSVESIYLKLYALSTGKAALRSLNLDGVFGMLPNVAWYGNTPIELDWLRENEIQLKLVGEYPAIDFVDKFPRYLQHIIPDDNTRILDTAKARFGSRLAPQTVLMPGASYMNLNSGTLGKAIIEGRVSSSAIVGEGTDVGGGASILGVLSGTDGIPITVGENCLLGANSVTGISLGDSCIVDAGFVILAGTKVKITAEELEKIAKANPGWIPINLDDIAEEYTFKGKDLQGLNGIHFRQDSTTGQAIAMRSTREVKLNEELHN